MKRQVLSTFTYVIVSLVFGAQVYHDYPYLSIIMWTSAGVGLTFSVFDWIYQWRKHRNTLKD